MNGLQSMSSYQIIVEGVFVGVREQRQRVGFHTTFFLEANSAANAAHKVRNSLQKRMQNHEVVWTLSGPYRSYFWIHNIWEVASETDQYAGQDLGFSFFLIGRVEGVYLVLRHWFLKTFRSWLMIPIN